MGWDGPLDCGDPNACALWMGAELTGSSLVCAGPAVFFLFRPAGSLSGCRCGSHGALRCRPAQLRLQAGRVRKVQREVRPSCAKFSFCPASGSPRRIGWDKGGAVPEGVEGLSRAGSGSCWSRGAMFRVSGIGGASVYIERHGTSGWYIYTQASIQRKAPT